MRSAPCNYGWMHVVSKHDLLRAVLTVLEVADNERVAAVATAALDKLPPMPQTNKDRQEALRARRLMLGMTEVRGIYLHPDQHAELKAYARKLAKQAEKRGAAGQIPPTSAAEE